MTTYFLADDDDIYRALDAFELPDVPTFPTILAERREAFVGVLGTNDRDDAVVAGPLAAKSPFVAKGLIEKYDEMLRQMGVKSYLFWVWTDDPKTWRSSIEKLPDLYRPLGEQDGALWYERDLTQEE